VARKKEGQKGIARAEISYLNLEGKVAKLGRLNEREGDHPVPGGVRDGNGGGGRSPQWIGQLTGEKRVAAVMLGRREKGGGRGKSRSS